MSSLAAPMLASTLGVEFIRCSMGERQAGLSNERSLVDSLSITAFARAHPNRDWTCAVAAAVFRFAAPTADDVTGAP